jgi:hypothetical protein
MNFLIFNRSAENLKTAIYGRHDEDLVAIAADDQGRLMFSPESLVTVTATNFDIRNLTSARDTVNVTATDFDIRNLSGSQDSVQVSAKGFVEAQSTLTVAANTTTYLLLREVAPYSQNSYFLRNTNPLTGAVTVSVEIAPVDSGDYYMATVTQSVAANSNFLAAVSTLMRYARLRVQTGGSAVGVDAYYNGRA